MSGSASGAGLALSLLVVALLSVLYEVVKMGKARVLRRALLAVPPSLSREELLEPEEGDGGHGATQGRYGPGRVGPCLVLGGGWEVGTG